VAKKGNEMHIYQKNLYGDSGEQCGPWTSCLFMGEGDPQNA
jgi:hypothetical protein